MLDILAALDSVDFKKQHILSDFLPFSTYKTILSAHYCDKEILKICGHEYETFDSY